MYPFFRYQRTNPLDIYDGHKVNLPDGTEIVIPKMPYKIEGKKITCMIAQIVKQCENKWALIEMKNGNKFKLYIWEVKLPKSISGLRFDESNFVWEEHTLDLVKIITC